MAATRNTTEGPQERRADLLAAAATMAGVAPERLSELLRVLDVAPARGKGARGVPCSTLNNDGSPLEIVVGACARGVRVRILADPAADEPDPERRLRRAASALDRVLDRHEEPGLSAAVHRHLDPCLPDARAATVWPGAAALWVAAAAQGRGFAAYTSGRWGEPATRWPRALRWLGEAAGPAAAGTLAATAERTAVASLGLEGSGREDLCVKIYFRLGEPAALGDLGLAPLCDPRVGRFLAPLLGREGIHPGGLVLSATFGLASGRLDSAKIDVCGHCVPRPPRAWADAIDGLAEDLGVANPGLRAVLTGGRAEIAFVGMGIDAGARARLNVYLKAVAPEEGTARAVAAPAPGHVGRGT